MSIRLLRTGASRQTGVCWRGMTGYTLAEVLVSLTILMIVFGLSVPAITSFIERRALDSGLRICKGSLVTARFGAIRSRKITGFAIQTTSDPQQWQVASDYIGGVGQRWKLLPKFVQVYIIQNSDSPPDVPTYPQCLQFRPDGTGVAWPKISGDDSVATIYIEDTRFTLKDNAATPPRMVLKDPTKRKTLTVFKLTGRLQDQ